MGTDVIMPALGMAQDTGKVLHWSKAPGEAVVQGEPLMEVETDKVTVEIEAPASGVLADVTVAPGEEVADRILRRMQEAVSHLDDHPALGRVGRIDGTRELVVTHTPYIVAYRIRHGDVHIHAVLRTARQWPTRL